MLTIYTGNSTVIELDALTNTLTAAIDNGATVTLTSLKDSAGVMVTGETFPKSMPYVAASSGKYRTTLSGAMNLTAGARYRAVLDITGSGGAVDHREIVVEAKYRQEI